MEAPTQRPSTDVSSRILSILSLIIAIGAMGFVYMQGHVAGSRAQLVSSFEKKLEEEAADYRTLREDLNATFLAALERQDERMEAWNSQLNSALATFQQDSTSVLSEMDSSERAASEQRELAFQKELGAYRALASGRALDPPDELDGPKNEEDPANIAPAISDNDTNKASGLANAASLRVVNTVLRPGTGNTTLIQIKNESAEDAWIERVRFRPEDVFPTTDAFELSTDAGGSSVTTIEYHKSDNTSTRAGFHGIYDRHLAEKLRVPAGEAVTYRVIINESQDEGWGFTGKMILDYNATESLTVESARVAFRGDH